MIRLNGGSRVLFKQNFIHPEQSGFGSVGYTFDHNIPTSVPVQGIININLNSGTIVQHGSPVDSNASGASGCYISTRTAGNLGRSTVTMYRLQYDSQSSYNCTYFVTAL